ncbi:unnamed protein product [Leptosia nina]|uniref:CRAL-TRIO domain-containing protein n=1 Tax=Leptosia nina TaxID=320188 RepID=A0AAV1IY65_9NEOP
MKTHWESTAAKMTDTQHLDEKATQYIQEMRTWLNAQPYLPKDNIDDIFLLRFVHSCYYDIDKAKIAMEFFFTLRLACPELLNNRDPLSPEMQKVMEIVNLGQIATPEDECVWFWQLNDPGLEFYDYLLDAKFFMLSTDSYFLAKKTLPKADIVVLDVKDLSLKFLTKFNISVARKLAKYQEGAIPIRLKQVHLINASSAMDKIFGLMKPFLKKELTDLVHFHTAKSDTLYKYVPKENLPADYGGPHPPLAEQHKELVSVILSKRKELMDDTLWRAIPSDKKKISNPSPPIVSSFRALAID